METTRKMSSTVTSSYSTTALTHTTKGGGGAEGSEAEKTPTTTNKSIKLLSHEKQPKNYTKTQQQEQQEDKHKRPQKLKRSEMMTTKYNKSQEILKNNMTETTAATTKTSLVKTIKAEYEEKTKPKDFNNKNYVVQKHISQQNNINSLRYDDNVFYVQENISNTLTQQQQQKLLLTNTTTTKKNISKSLERNPFVNFYKDQPTLEQPTMSNSSSSINELYTNNPDIFREYTSTIQLQQNNYPNNGQRTKIQDLNKSYQTTLIKASTSTTMMMMISTTTSAAITTTKKPLRLTTKQNHMYDNISALTYLPYQSAALKASAPDMKTLNNNLNIFSRNSRSSSSSSSRTSSSSSLKRDTLMSLAGILTTTAAKTETKTAVVDNSFMKNSTNTHIHIHNTNDEENLLNTQYNFKSNNTLAHDTLAMKQISQTTMKTLLTTATNTSTTTPTTLIALNELSSSSSLPFNVSSSSSATYSVTSTISTTKEIPTTTTTTATSTSRTTLKSTTRRRKIPTTTLKPPPTIDDYQTITSQAGTHAYLPCNVSIMFLFSYFPTLCCCCRFKPNTIVHINCKNMYMIFFKRAQKYNIIKIN